MAQVVACCLMAPSHYLNQCWLISESLGHSSEGIIKRRCKDTNQWKKISKNAILTIAFRSPKGQGVQVSYGYFVKICNTDKLTRQWNSCTFIGAVHSWWYAQLFSIDHSITMFKHGLDGSQGCKLLHLAYLTEAIACSRIFHEYTIYHWSNTHVSVCISFAEFLQISSDVFHWMMVSDCYLKTLHSLFNLGHIDVCLL